jgi:dTDP-4-dehydrorhamnose reductase
VARLAARRGWRVVGTHLTREPRGFESIRLDVRDPGAVDRVFGEVRPDRVIHTAYRQSGDDADRVNAEGSANVAAAVARAHCRLVHISTDVIFSGRLGRPYREGDRPDPITDYGRSKAEAERAVAERAPGAAIVRTSLLVAGREPNPRERDALAAAGGRAAYGFYIDELRCPLAVGEAAATVIEVAHLQVAGPLHVAGPDAVSRYELACLIARAAGRGIEAIPKASGAAVAGRPADCRLDSSMARRLLSTRVRGVREVYGAKPVEDV